VGVAPKLLVLAALAIAFGALAAAAAEGPRAPEPLAESALDRLPGTAAAGTLRGDVMRFAVRGAARGAVDAPVFEIGSISKVFTGLLLAQAVEHGDLRLDQSLGELLGTRVRFESRRTSAITLKQLVTHTSCLPNLPENPKLVPAAAQITSYDRAQLWQALGKLDLDQRAPCASKYSNFGFAVLGELLAERAGRSWGELVRARIAAPLGMKDTAVEVPAPRLVDGFVRDVPAGRWNLRAFAGAGGLRSTARDLLVFSRALIDGRRGPLGPAAERVVAPLAPYGTGKVRIGYGVILPDAPSPVWTHNGITGGQVAEWIVWPARREAAVILVSNLASPARTMARSMIREPR
jgi:serine-type D-Ala-D-Ala carboxypeptidase/endopeptidase